MEAIISFFNTILNIGLGVAVTVAACFLMCGAFQYMAAAGNPRQMETGISAMRGAVVGLVLAISARVIAQMIQSSLATSGIG